MEVSTRKCFIERSFHLEEDQLCDPPPSEAQEGITTLSLPFNDDDLLHASDSNEERKDQHDLGIEAQPHEILDPDRATFPNQRPKPRWDQKFIVTAGDGVGNLGDRRRTRSQYQNEHVSLSHTDSLSTECCNNSRKVLHDDSK